MYNPIGSLVKSYFDKGNFSTNTNPSFRNFSASFKGAIVLDTVLS